MLPEKIMLAFEIIGTISFAVSGALRLDAGCR